MSEKPVKLCCKCHENPRARSSRYCRPCGNAAQRKWRKANPLKGEALMKANARALAGIYKRRGKIPQKPCLSCGSPDAQMHHEDYSKPLEVEWLCRECHHLLHKYEPNLAPREDEIALMTLSGDDLMMWMTDHGYATKVPSET